MDTAEKLVTLGTQDEDKIRLCTNQFEYTLGNLSITEIT